MFENHRLIRHVAESTCLEKSRSTLDLIVGSLAMHERPIMRPPQITRAKNLELNELVTRPSRWNRLLHTIIGELDADCYRRSGIHGLPNSTLSSDAV